MSSNNFVMFINLILLIIIITRGGGNFILLIATWGHKIQQRCLKNIH
jgi:hypothetical protein